jgi:hypothetical protein
MDPTSFTKTSFCGKEVDNITENEAKEYILNQMSILCSGIKYNGRYAKVYNTQYANNLRNPHIVCLKSSGTPYLMFLTQINQTDYCFLIDKRVKEGYSYPKIFSLPYHFHSEMYKGSLFECELLRDRDKDWSILIGDSYHCSGKSTKNVVIMERISQIHAVLSEKFVESEFTETCPLVIKRYADYHEIKELLGAFAESLSYDIRGLYFVPLRCSYSKILLMFPRKGQSPTNGQSNKTPKKSVTQAQVAKKAPIAKQAPPIAPPNATSTLSETFRIMKTLKPDVYELYRVSGTDLEKVGIALVQTLEISRYLCALFQGKGQCDEVFAKCVYSDSFQKWAPVK